MKEKKRPTLDQLKSMPREMIYLELGQISADSAEIGLLDVEREADKLLASETVTAEQVVELRDKLLCASGSTVAEKLAA